MGCGSGMTCWRRLKEWQEHDEHLPDVEPACLRERSTLLLLKLG
jgi:hypothetical protein